MSAGSHDANNSNNGRVAGLNVAAVAVGGCGSEDVEVVGGGEGCQIAALDMEMRIEVKGVVIEKSGVKKRGRPARFQARAQPKATQPRAQPKAQANVVDDEEDVCFICFDGGNLVLCDRRNVLVKGGDLPTSLDAVDTFYDGQNFYDLHASRVETCNAHGTGCTLSSCIAAEMAKGSPVLQAVKSFVRKKERSKSHLM